MPARTPVEQLFDALKGGDEAALEHHLPPLRERITRLAKERLGDTQKAQEVAQETLSTVWAKRGSIRDADHLLPFVFQTLRHKIGSNYLRSRREREKRSGVETRGALVELESGNPERMMEARELEASLAGAIERCAEENRTWGRVLQLLRDGRSALEIQRVMGDVPMATVHTRIHRARARLRSILRDEYRIEL